jgi:uncharacterized protein
MARPEYDPWVREILRCPVGLHELVDTEDEQGAPVLQCAQDCGAPGQRRRYPVTEGIPVLLADEAVLVAAPGS